MIMNASYNDTPGYVYFWKRMHHLLVWLFETNPGDWMQVQNKLWCKSYFVLWAGILILHVYCRYYCSNQEYVCKPYPQLWYRSCGKSGLNSQIPCFVMDVRLYSRSAFLPYITNFHSFSNSKTMFHYLIRPYLVCSVQKVQFCR